MECLIRAVGLVDRPTRREVAGSSTNDIDEAQCCGLGRPFCQRL